MTDHRHAFCQTAMPLRCPGPRQAAGLLTVLSLLILLAGCGYSGYSLQARQVLEKLTGFQAKCAQIQSKEKLDALANDVKSEATALLGMKSDLAALASAGGTRTQRQRANYEQSFASICQKLNQDRGRIAGLAGGADVAKSIESVVAAYTPPADSEKKPRSK